MSLDEPAHDEKALTLIPADVKDRALLSRLRAPRSLARFVHWNDFWLDRSSKDPNIRMFLVREGGQQTPVGCVAIGPHEAVDLDHHSRVPGVDEIYHLVIDRAHVRRGYGAGTVRLAVEEMRRRNSQLAAVRLAHHPDNFAAESLYSKLGFMAVEIGRAHV